MSEMHAPVLGVRHTPPAFAMPPGACDCHVHVFGPPERYPFVEDRIYMPSLATAADLLGMQQSISIERTVIVQASPQGTDNTCLLDAVAELRDQGRQARGVAVVDEDASATTLRMLRSRGIRGLRVNLESRGHRDASQAQRAVLATARLAADHGMHVQLYTNPGMVKAIAGTLSRIPVPAVIDHFGLASPRLGRNQPGLSVLLDLVASGRLYVKLSAPYRILSGPDAAEGHWLVRSLIEANARCMLWGTDWPHTGAWPGQARLRDRPEPFHPIDDGMQLNIFGAWTTELERRLILSENPARLYEFQ